MDTTGTDLSSTLAEAYKEKSRLAYLSNRNKEIGTTMVASLVAWFALYVSLALDKGGVLFPLFATFGVLILLWMAYSFYRDGKYHAKESALIEAEIQCTIMHYQSKQG